MTTVVGDTRFNPPPQAHFLHHSLLNKITETKVMYS